MATGVAIRTTPNERASAAAMRASADKSKALVLLRQAPLVSRDFVDRLVERAAGQPTRQLLQRAGVRPAAAELLKPGTVGVRVGHEPDGRPRAGPLDDAARERDDRDLLGRPDVEDATTRAIGLREQQHRMDSVADMQEAAHLRAVSVHGQVFAGQCLPDEARNDHAVAIALARAHYVEEPSDHDWGLA